MSTDRTTDASTRRRLLDAAADLLAASPSGDVATRAVCEAAGVTSPTLYHHFGDKDSLLQAVVADGFERCLAGGRSLPGAGDPVDDLRRGWDQHVEFGLRNPRLYALMYGRPATGRMSPAAYEAVEILAGHLRAIDGRGRLRTDVAAAVRLTVSATVGITLLLIRQGATDPADPLSLMLREAVLAALLQPVDATPLPGVAAPLPGVVAALSGVVAAGALRAVLPDPPVAGPRTCETALVRDRLAVLADVGPAPAGSTPTTGARA